MKQSPGLVGVEAPGPAVVPGIFTEDAPTKPRTWACQHCGKLNSGRVLASLNGAPLCLPERDSGDVNCYRLVSQLNHDMPCPSCPGDKPMEHNHGGEEDLGEVEA